MNFAAGVYPSEVQYPAQGKGGGELNQREG